MGEVNIPKPTINSESSLIRSSRSSLERTTKQRMDQSKEPQEPLKGGIVKHEPSFGEKVKRSFVKEDFRDIRDYVVLDIIIPSIKKAFFDAIVGTTAQIFGVSLPANLLGGVFGGGFNQQKLTPHERQYRDYSSIAPGKSSGYSGNAVNYSTPQVRYDRFYAEDWPFTYKEDANRVLTQMIDICDTYGWVSVSKFFELADPKGTVAGRNPYTNQNYGWYSLDNVPQPRYVAGVGYIIDLPPARPK